MWKDTWAVANPENGIFFFFYIIADRDDSRGKEEKTSVGAEGTVTRGSKGILLDSVRYRYIFDQILVEENLLQQDWKFSPDSAGQVALSNPFLNGKLSKRVV